MGKIIQYKCINCNFLFKSMDGVGMFTELEVKCCLRCKILVDVQVEEMDDLFHKHEDGNADDTNCPNCKKSDKLLQWDKKKRICPLCGTKMKGINTMGIWD